LDSNGRPLELPLEGSGSTFASLVKKYGGDIPPGAMRTELKRVGALEETAPGVVRVVKRYFRPVEKEEQLERALGQAIYGLGLNLNHNLGQSPENSWVERIAYSTKIRATDAGRVRRISQDRAADFVESINDLFSAYETIYSDEQSDDQATAACMLLFSIFSFTNGIESRNVCIGVLPKQYFPLWTRSSLYSLSQVSKSVCSSSSEL